ncbi:Uncharacterised protein [uncultured archaeon]|nr:Uncharacterised protein [uncultured archaeon]
MHEYEGVSRAWVGVFDPAMQEKKSELVGLLRKGLKDSEFTDCFTMAPAQLPKNTIAAVVMSGGYEAARWAYPYLRDAYGIEKVIYPGYSTGWYSKKKFSDGSQMAGKVYMLEDDVRTVQKNPDAPLLFIDEFLQRGVTVKVIKNTLSARLGHSGEFYMIAGNVWHSGKKGTEYEIMDGHQFLAAKEASLRYYLCGGPASIVTENGNQVKNGKIVAIDGKDRVIERMRNCVRGR